MLHQYVDRIFPTELHPLCPRKTGAPPTVPSSAGATGYQRIEGREIGEPRPRQIASRQTQRSVPHSEEV
jgi:hypothetical protein